MNRPADRFPLERVPRAVRAIAARLREAGHETWYVGGAVRDVLYEAQTGRAPARAGDFDIATSALPEEVRRLFRRTVPVGIAHGTLAVLDEEGGAHEVTTFRKDVRTDGRHAEVEFGVALDEDLARRDFTINAVAVHPDTGEVRDPFGGREDLAAGTLRAVGEARQRFREDRLRVLRALRFAAALGLDIEPDTWAAVVEAAHDLAHLSRERVRDEWVKTLATGAPSVGIGLWRRAGVLAEVWPELASLEAAHDVRLDAIAPRDPVLVTAAALSRAERTAAEGRAAVERLRFSGQDAERVEAVIAGLAGGLPEAEPGAVRRWLARHRPWVEDILAAAEPEARREQVREVVREVRDSGAPLGLEDLAVNGHDLIAAGVPAGPALGALLRRLLDDVLADPSLNSRERLLARAKELV